jgi:hypothetical protein
MVGLAVGAEALGTEAATIPPEAIGIGVFVVLLLLLFIVTRFNPDR